MSLLDVTISIINRFCDNFKENFSNTQFRAFAMLAYAMLKDYKRLNLSALAKELPIVHCLQNNSCILHRLAQMKGYEMITDIVGNICDHLCNMQAIFCRQGIMG
jgi:hypothetical protein